MIDCKPSPRRAWIAAGVAALATALAPPARAACSLKMMELPVKMVGNNAIATVAIDGQPVPLVVDTGGFFSMLTEAAASQMNLRLDPLPYGLEIRGLTGKVRAHMTTVSKLQLGKGTIPNVDFVVGGNEFGNGAMGLMGRNMLSFTDTEYDLAHGIIRFVFPSEDCDHANLAYWAADTPVAELALKRQPHESTPELRANITLNGRAVSALFDSGATTLVRLSSAHHVGVEDSDLTAAGTTYGVGSGRAQVWTAAFDKVDFGGEAIEHNRLEVADLDMGDDDMLIGIDFFLSHHIYVSKKQSRMYFTYNGGPVFTLNQGERGRSEGSDAASSTMTADEFARRGAASQSRGDLAGALADLDRACAMEPGNVDFLATRATIHAALESPDLALADLDAALRLDPAQDEVRLRRAWLLSEKGERARTLEDLAALDKHLAPQSDRRREMAEIYAGLTLPAQALAQWDLWIAAHRHDVTLDAAYSGRCWARVEMNVDLDKALDDCDEAVDADSKNASFLDGRGWAYLRLGKLAKAKADFDRALALKKDDAWSLYGRALVHQRLNEGAAAQSDLAAARQAEHAIDAAIELAGLPKATP